MSGALIQLPNKFAIALLTCVGTFGNYPERKERLEKMGYNYKEIQSIVNKLLPIIKEA